jgi:hypothetical protein
MGFVPVTAGRAQVHSVPGGIELSIPARRKIVLILFFSFWLVGWCFGEVMVSQELLWPTHPAHGDPPPFAFLAMWLCGWTVGGAFVLLSVLWMLAGRERAIFTGDAVTLRREVFGVGLSTMYQPSAVRDLRVIDIALPFALSFGRDTFGLSSGPIAFDYGAKTIRFAAGVDSAEAKQLVAKVLAAKPGFGPNARS